MAASLMRQFVEKWVHVDYRPTAVPSAALDAAERALGATLPGAYRESMEQVGAASADLRLLSTIVDQELGILDVADFLAPKELVTATEGWRKAGLPSNMIAFATDCSGNLFCFKTKAKDRCEQDAEVWFFNHEEGEVQSVGLRFSEWLSQFVAIDAARA